jgi:hypothetical protein
MPNGTEEDEPPADEPGGEGSEDASRPPEGFADEGTTVGINDPSTPSGYWRISGIALAAIAILGIAINLVGGNYAYVPDVDVMENILVFDWAHNVVHVLLAAIALAFGFTGLRTSDASKPTAGVIGVVYLALGVAGFFTGFTELLDDLVGLGLETGENILHLVLGAWGAYVGFLSDAPY